MSLTEQILRNSRTVAVVGLSSNPDRSSYGVASYLQTHGYRIIPVNPKETEILGEKVYARLEDIPEPVDVVDVFRKPEYTPDVVRSAIAIGAKAVWLQLGIASEESRRLAEAAGVPYVEDTCIAVAHRFLK
jgi:hypothetical protein